MTEKQHRELEEKTMRFRAMEHDVTDPLAIGLIHDIVEELEAALAAVQRVEPTI